MGSVRDLVVGLQKKASIDEETARNIRVYEVHGGKVHREYNWDSPVLPITEFSSLYAEVIPEEELNAVEGDSAIFCYHFDKDPNKPHGAPFKFVIKSVSI